MSHSPNSKGWTQIVCGRFRIPSKNSIRGQTLFHRSARLVFKEWRLRLYRHPEEPLSAQKSLLTSKYSEFRSHHNRFPKTSHHDPYELLEEHHTRCKFCCLEIQWYIWARNLEPCWITVRSVTVRKTRSQRFLRVLTRLGGMIERRLWRLSIPNSVHDRLRKEEWATDVEKLSHKQPRGFLLVSHIEEPHVAYTSALFTIYCVW